MSGRLCRAVVPVAAILAVLAFAAPAGADPPTPTFPPSGAFVIGDGNAVAGSAVTFWGAQWWKDNAVSKGSAPPAFKGFASDLGAQSCGPFTADPGNSAPPPDGPLPPFMLTLVTDSVTKSGRTISGDVVGFAVVATDDGYASDPGHPGTGTVISFVSCATF